MTNPEILYHEKGLFVVNKPFLMLSARDKEGEAGVNEWAFDHLHQPKYWLQLQRVDRVAGGLISFAYARRTGTAFQEMQAKRELHKTYLVIVEGKPDDDKATLKHFMRKVPGSMRHRAYDNPVKGSKSAELSYELLETKGDRSLLAVRLFTGRTHQIRCQLQRIGCTVVGDKKYGKTNALADQSIALFSHRLSFNLEGEDKLIEAPYPAEREVWSDFKTPILDR